MLTKSTQEHMKNSNGFSFAETIILGGARVSIFNDDTKISHLD